jgi:hypothetical protein
MAFLNNSGCWCLCICKRIRLLSVVVSVQPHLCPPTLKRGPVSSWLSMNCTLPCCSIYNTGINIQANGLHQLRRYMKVHSAAAAHHHMQQQPQRGSPPTVDYSYLLHRHKQVHCPALFLAPMENLADRPARIALKQAIGEHQYGYTDCTANNPHNNHECSFSTQAASTRLAQVSS